MRQVIRNPLNIELWVNGKIAPRPDNNGHRIRTDWHMMAMSLLYRIAAAFGSTHFSSRPTGRGVQYGFSKIRNDNWMIYMQSRDLSPRPEVTEPTIK